MNNLLKFAMGMGVATGAIAASGTYGLLTNAYSDNNRGDWDWQYKGSAFKDRVGNFTLFSDNKSRYNDYLKGYNKTIGYNFDLSGIDAKEVNNTITNEYLYKKGDKTYGANENLLLIGNPTGANTKDSNNLILENKLSNGVSPFVTSYNTDKKRPNWVAFKLTKEDYGSIKRIDNFRADPNISPKLQMDAKGIQQYQRGHNYPSGSATSSRELNDSTFVMTNMTAQAGNMNAGPWADLEHYLAYQVTDKKKEVQVLTGNSGTLGVINGVEIPKVMWKVAIILEPGQTKVTDKAQTVIAVMPNKNNVKTDWKDYRTADGKQLKKQLGIDQFFPAMDKDLEDKILSNMYEPPSDKSKLLNLDAEVGNNFQSAAIIRARSRGIHNPLMAPIYDQDKQMKGFVFNNKKSHSESFELARYNASMRATGRFNSVVDPQDINTYETLLRGTKQDGQLNDEELRFARAYDLAVNTPTMASRINEFFFIPMGLGRVYKEEKGIVPSLFGVIGSLIDQSYLVNNPIMATTTQEGEDYFTTKTTLFQDLFEGSAAGILASASSVAVYLTVGAPLKVMASEAIVRSQEGLIEAASKNNRMAKLAVGGNANSSIGFKLAVADRIANGNAMPFYDVDNPTFSLYWLDNYERHRGGSFFAATAQQFLLNKVSPYKLESVGYVKLRSAINDYLNVLQSPADLVLIDRTAETSLGVKKAIDWNTATIDVSTGKIKIKDAVSVIRNAANPNTGPFNQGLIDEINAAVNAKYEVKITNVSLERSMELAKKTQGILNLMPMPWAWGIFNGRTMNDVTGPMIGNLLDIEGFTRHINASINNQGFWGAANEFMEFSESKTNVARPAYRIVNHIATITRSILAFNENGAQSKADLEGIMKISNTYSDAEIKINNASPKTIGDIDSGYKVIDTDSFNAGSADDKALRDLLSNEAMYQKRFKELSGNRPSLNTITFGDEKLFQYANSNRASSSLGFILNTLDNGGSYLGLKIASTKLSAAKYLLGGAFIVQLAATEYMQRGGASILKTAWAQSRLNAANNHTAELSSTQFISAKEVASYLGANADLTNVVGGLESIVMLVGTSRWAWEHASTFSPEIQSKLFMGEAVIDLIDDVSTSIDPATGKPTFNKLNGTGYAGLEDALKVKGSDSKTKIIARIGGEEISFNVERNPATKQIIGLKSLTAKVGKNYTSFAMAIGITMAAMQTARFVVSSAINSERQMMGSSVIATYALALPAVAIATTALADNIVHSVNSVTGLGYSNYKLTSGLVKGFTIGKNGFEVGILPSIQGLANLFGKGTIGSTIASIGLIATVAGAYMFKLSPFQGDINGPKLDDTGATAIAKLGAYSRQVLQRIADIEANKTGNTDVSSQVSPLEVNAALFSMALGKIINPIVSSQKGSTAYVMAIQSPTPVFQYYSVLKKVIDATGNSYTTINVGLQGPPLFGFAPINVSLPIAVAMNAKSSDGEVIKTGYFGSGIMLNENSKDSLNLADYFTVYSNLMLASSAALTVSNTLSKNQSFSRNQQI